MNIIYKIYSFCIALPLFVVATITTALIIMTAALLGDKDKTDYFMSKLWSKFTCRVFLLGIKVEGKEKLNKKMYPNCCRHLEVLMQFVALCQMQTI